MSPEKKIYNSLDIAKFIAALNVVILHTEPLSSVCGTHATDFVSAMVRWAIPFFFCSSAFLFFRYKADIRKYVVRIIQLYIVWLIIKIPFVYQFFFTTDQPLVMQVLSFVRGLLFHDTFFGSWYLSASVEAMILLWFLSCRCKLSNKTLLILGVLMYVPALLRTSYFGLLSQQVQDIIAIIPFANSFFVAFLYMVIGKVIAEGFVLKISTCRWVMCVMALLFVMEAFVVTQDGFSIYTDAMLVIPFMSYVLMCMLVQTEKVTIEYGCILRKLSIIIYLLHPIVMWCFSQIVQIENSVLLSLSTIVVSTFIGFAIVKGSETVKLLRYLY